MHPAQLRLIADAEVSFWTDANITEAFTAIWSCRIHVIEARTLRLSSDALYDSNSQFGLFPLGGVRTCL